LVTPYITFSGDCNAALDFYRTVFHTEIQLSYPYGDYVPEGVAVVPPDLKDWILHAEMQICGTAFWFADEAAEPVTKGNMVKLTVKVPTAKEAQEIFDALRVDARITLPPTETFYSSFHAGLTDRFGVGWNIVAEESPNGAALSME
jgi:PhnB protein